MNIEEIREFALSLPHVTEDMPFGPDALALRIGGKIFCLLELSGHWQFYNLKVDPDFSLDLRDRYYPSRYREKYNSPRISSDSKESDKENARRIRL